MATTVLGQGTTAITITFALAIVGYLGLTATMIISFHRRRVPYLLWRPVALVILTHVLLVWMFRYQWDFSLAVRNGYFGFILFHSALGIIVASIVTNAAINRVLVLFAYLIVTAGALGATFRYDVVTIYRIPVILGALSGLAYLSWYRLKSTSTN